MVRDTKTEKKTKAKTQTHLAGKANFTEENAPQDRTNGKLITVQARMDYLLSHGPQVIYAVEPSGDFRTTFISPNVKELVGYEPQEFCQDSCFWQDRVHPEDRDRTTAGRDSAGEHDRTSQEYRFLNSAGDYIWMRDEEMLVRDKAGNPRELIGYWSDINEQMEARYNQAESEASYRSLAHFSPDGIFLSKNYQIIFANPAMFSMFGAAEAEDVIGRHFFDFIHPDERDQAEARYKTLNEQGRSVPPVESKLLRLDGVVVDIEITSSPIPYQGDTVIQTIVRDISASKKAERQILRQSRLLEAVNEILTRTLTAESVVEVATTCLDVAERLTKGKFSWIGLINQAGLLDKVAISDSGRAACRMANPESPKFNKNLPVHSFWKAVLEKGSSVLINAPASHPSSVGVPKGHPEIASFLGIPLKRSGDTYGLIALANKQGGFSHRDREDMEVLSVAFTECLDRIQAQRTVKESRKRLKTTMDSITAGVMIIDVETRIIVDANLFALSLIGASREQVVGTSCHSFVCPAEMEKCPVLDLKQTVDNSERVLLGADGHERPIIKTVVPIRFDDRDCLLETFIDISQRKKLEAQLIRAQKMEAIGMLAGGIAHDFNNILTVILGYSQLSINQIPEESKLYRNIDQVIKAGFRARDLVDQILAISRHVKTGFKPVIVSAMVKEVLKFLKASTPANIELRQDITTECTITADPSKLHQVIMNLCTNAVQAMEEQGGILEVGLSEFYLDPTTAATQFPTLAPGLFVRMTISDTGPGMTPEIQDRIFEPYYTTKTEGEGTGLGLAVTHGIVQAHGGTIRVYSEPGQGSIFHVLLPAVTDQAPSAVHSEIPYYPLDPKRILFVDDEREIVEIARRMLESMGHRVTATTSALTALGMFTAEPDKFDLVITDMTMPEINGDQLALRLMRVRPEMPVILCTGFNKRISEEKALSVGIRGFVMKPFDQDRLSLTIHKVLRKVDDTG